MIECSNVSGHMKIHHALGTLALLLFATLFAVRPCFGAAYVRTIEPNRHWSVGNDSVERSISFSSENGLRTDALTYKVTGRDFTSFSRSRHEYGDELQFKANKTTVTGRTLLFTSADLLDVPGGKGLRLNCRTREEALAVSVVYVVYDDGPALRKWIEITNKSEQDVVLKNLMFEALAAGPGTPAELAVTGGYGAVPREIFFTGRASDPAVFVRNSSTGEGFAVLNEAPGYLKRTEAGEGWNEVFHVMYDSDLFPFERRIRPGETFETAKCSLVFFADGRGFADSHWSVPTYVSRHIMRRQPGGPPPWIFNTWEPFLRNIDEKTLTDLAPIAKAVGVEVFTIDDGWQADYGSNDIDLKNFPGGFARIHSVLEQNGLKLGLWVPLAAISTNSIDYRSHPEWVCRDRDGAPKFTNTASGTSGVMCLGSAYRDAALKRLEDLVTRYKPAYIKVDLTTVFNAYGEAPGCYASGHAHHDWTESLTRIYEGLIYIGQQLYRTHPEVLVDYTFELWGEKHLIDPALLEAADLDWLSNINDRDADSGGPLQARTLLYQRAPSIPVESMLIGNLRAATGSIEEHFGTAIGSAPLFLGDLRKLSESDRKWYAERTRWYLDLRRRSSLPDSFFPLGSWQQPVASSWDGFARLSSESDGIIAIFKNQSHAESAQIRLVAPPDARYEVRSEITGKALGRVMASTLRDGWKVAIPSEHAVEVLELRRTKP